MGPSTDPSKIPEETARINLGLNLSQCNIFSSPCDAVTNGGTQAMEKDFMVHC